MNNTLTCIDPSLENKAEPIPTKINFRARRIENGRVSFSAYGESRAAFDHHDDVEINSVVIGLLPVEPGVYSLHGVDFVESESGWKEIDYGCDYVVVSSPIKNTLLGKLITHEFDYFRGNTALS